MARWTRDECRCHPTPAVSSRFRALLGLLALLAVLGGSAGASTTPLIPSHAYDRVASDSITASIALGTSRRAFPEKMKAAWVQSRSHERFGVAAKSEVRVLRDAEGATPEQLANSVGGPTAGSRVGQSQARQDLLDDADGVFTCWRCGQQSSNPANMHLGHRNAPSRGEGTCIETTSVLMVPPAI